MKWLGHGADACLISLKTATQLSKETGSGEYHFLRVQIHNSLGIRGGKFLAWTWENKFKYTSTHPLDISPPSRAFVDVPVSTQG